MFPVSNFGLLYSFFQGPIMIAVDSTQDPVDPVLDLKDHALDPADPILVPKDPALDPVLDQFLHYPTLY